MNRQRLRVISINFTFYSQGVTQEGSLATDKALFDFDVVVIRPPQFDYSAPTSKGYQFLESMMNRKRNELARFLAQGGVLVVFLDIPDTYTVDSSGYSSGPTYRVNNYEFLGRTFSDCLRSGVGKQISYSDPVEPFVGVLKNSSVAWTSYVVTAPAHPFNDLRFFALAGASAWVGGKMPYGQGHLILLPNLERLDEDLFFEACADYRYKQQGTKPPGWLSAVFLPGLELIESEIARLEKQIQNFRVSQEEQQQKLEDQSAYKKLLYEKGKTQLEPVVRLALNDLGFEATEGEIIKGTDYEIDGRTAQGSVRGILEVKGSKKQIALDDFSPLGVKILADLKATDISSKGILVGNGLCETEPQGRLGDAVFSPHVLKGASTQSVALVNSVELYWLCCTLLTGDTVDKEAVRETILAGNGYVDLKPFCGVSPFE